MSNTVTFLAQQIALLKVLLYKVHTHRITYYQDVYHSTFSTKGIPLLVVLQLFQMIGRQGKYFGFLNMAAKIYLPLQKLL